MESAKTLQYASDELRNDRKVVLEAVKNDGRMLQYASNELRNDHEVALEAVKKYGFALRYASDELKNNHDVVLEAVKINSEALLFASQSIIDYDAEIVLEAVANQTRTLDVKDNILLKGLLKNEPLHHYIAKLYASHDLRIESYRSSFLCGVIQSRAWSSDDRCKLSGLTKLGKFGLLEVKKLIGQYAGLRYGEFWDKIRKAFYRSPRAIDFLRRFKACESNSEVV